MFDPWPISWRVSPTTNLRMLWCNRHLTTVHCPVWKTAVGGFVCLPLFLSKLTISSTNWWVSETVELFKRMLMRWAQDWLTCQPAERRRGYKWLIYLFCSMSWLFGEPFNSKYWCLILYLTSRPFGKCISEAINVLVCFWAELISPEVHNVRSKLSWRGGWGLNGIDGVMGRWIELVCNREEALTSWWRRRRRPSPRRKATELLCPT